MPGWPRHLGTGNERRGDATSTRISASSLPGSWTRPSSNIRTPAWGRAIRGYTRPGEKSGRREGLPGRHLFRLWQEARCLPKRLSGYGLGGEMWVVRKEKELHGAA